MLLKRGQKVGQQVLRDERRTELIVGSVSDDVGMVEKAGNILNRAKALLGEEAALSVVVVVC